MLIDSCEIDIRDPLLHLIALVGGNSSAVVRISTGIYEIGHFGCSDFLKTFERYPQFDNYFDSCGVCDYWEQIIKACPEISESEKRKFLITLTPVIKAEQPQITVGVGINGVNILAIMIRNVNICMMKKI